MSRLHGNKRYFQLLLDPERAEVIDQEAARKKVRATALIREWIYEKLASLNHVRTPRN